MEIGIGELINFKQKNFLTLKISFLISLVLVLIYLPFIEMKVVGRDSGVFIYTGQLILRGQNPYVNSWDHKGIFLYYLNAAALQIFTNIMSVTIMELILNIMCVVISVILLSKIYSQTSVFIGVSIGVLSYFRLLEYPNLTETWSFGIMLVCYSLASLMFNSSAITNKLKLKIVLLQLQLSVLLLLIRPNNAIGCLVATFFSARVLYKERFIRNQIGPYLILLTVNVVVIGFYFSINKNLGEFWDQYIVYNLSYSSRLSPSERIVNLEHILKLASTTPILVSTSLLLIFSTKIKRELRSKFGILITICAFDLMMSALSGLFMMHYLIIVLPITIILTVHLFNQISQINLKIKWKYLGVLIFVLSLFLIFAFQQTSQFSKRLNENSFLSNKEWTETRHFIENNSDTSDKIYIYGAETRYLIQPFRISATSITYLYPALGRSEYAIKTAQRMNQDIRKYFPRLIVQTMPFSNSDNSELLSLKEFIERNYKAKIASGGKIIFWEKN